MNLYSLHRNKEHWKDPHTFRPERFIRNGVVVQVTYNHLQSTIFVITFQKQ